MMRIPFGDVPEVPLHAGGARPCEHCDAWMQGNGYLFHQKGCPRKTYPVLCRFCELRGVVSVLREEPAEGVRGLCDLHVAELRGATIKWPPRQGRGGMRTQIDDDGEATTPETAKDVRVQVSGEDGNVYAIIGRTRRALLRFGFVDEAREYTAKALAAKSYDEVLQITLGTVDVR